MTTTAQRAATGIAGLDDILRGGFVQNRLYLVEGMPGSGKTTLAFQFLMEGVRRGERVLYVTLSETEEEIGAIVESHGWSMQGITVRQLIPDEESLGPDEQYTMFHPSEVELGETTKKILADVVEFKPARVVFDSLSELRLLSGNPLRYRRQILALKQFLSGRRCTVLMLDDLTAAGHDLQVQSIAHGAILLEHSNPGYGLQRRRLSVSKYRGSDFRSGYHDYTIKRGGLEVYPRLIAREHRTPPERRSKLDSGLAELDALLGGGIDRGTSTLVSGAAGTGKSTLAALFAANACAKGEHAAMFVFDESLDTLFKRMAGLNLDLAPYVDSGALYVKQVDPAELSPGQFVEEVRSAVTERDSGVVVIDSLNGYLHAMPDEHSIIIQLHEVLMYLGHQGVATLLVSTYSGLIGTTMKSSVDASYLADSIMMLRYYETQGEVRQAISVVKKRGGSHERSLREFSMKDGHVQVGETLSEYRGVLTGVPEKMPS